LPLCGPAGPEGAREGLSAVSTGVTGRGRVPALVVLLAVLLAACSGTPAPAPAPPPPTPAPKPSEIVVAVDDLGPGFNPHLLAHQSPVTTALAGLVLPSVFRPDATGSLQPDPTVATSAEVSSQSPFTVTYELNLEASWTSNAPIAAEDFVYLWQRMRDEPGVADAAGYRLITDVRSRAAGKAVDVVFSRPYPAWKTLFSDLLPAHLLKDAPGSWTGALTNGLPASGGPFRVVAVDRARGEVLLTRNDQYWDTPAVLDQLVLRRLDGVALADGLGVGDVDVALPEPDEAVRTALGGLQPPPHVQTAPQSVITELALRTDDGPLADTRVRQAVGALIDREALRTKVAPDAPAADAFALAPSEPGYASTAPAGAPARPDAAKATSLLNAAGWTRGTDGRWRVAGEPVRLVIGAAAERPTDLAVAEAVSTQLDAAGIDSTVVAPTGVELFGQPTVPPTPPSSSAVPSATASPTTAATPTSTPAPSATTTATATASPTPTPAAGVSVDVVVRPRTVGGDPATELASDFGCADPSTPNGPPPRPAVPSTCSSSLQPLLDELVADPDPGSAATTRAAVEKLLWTQVPALPLFQPVTLLVSTPGADAGTAVGPGPLITGPLTGAQRWREPAR
jgi:ABC-type transport system substrate-binding protein